ALSADHAPRHRPDLVRHPDRRDRGNWPHQPSGRHEPVRAEDAAAAGSDRRRVPRRHAVHVRRLRAARDPDRVPDHLAVAAGDDEVSERERGYFIERVGREMDADLPELQLSVPDALAAACRILAREEHESGLAGQVTARAEKPDTWWTLQFGYGFEEATAERMALVDADLKPLAGGRPNPGVRFHVWIYRNRPDVNAIIHTHAPWASALGATGKPLQITHIDSAI